MLEVSRVCAIIYFFISLVTAAPTPAPGEFQKCQKTYSAITGHIVESSGVKATSEIWRLLFHQVDLDGNNRVTASEIALFLEKESFVHQSDIMEVVKQASAWVAVGEADGGQIDFDEFLKIVLKTIGKKSKSSPKYVEVSNCLCLVFNKKVPHLLETMMELSSCTKNLKKAILQDESERAEFNSWAAIFKTLDSNGNYKIEFEELKNNFHEELDENDKISLIFALGSAIYGDVHHDVSDISEQSFYLFIHELLYGVKKSKRANVWGGIASEQELHGRTLMCNVISGVRKLLISQRVLLSDCSKSYKKTTQKALGADSVFAPEIIFTAVDTDKDGHMSEHEFNSFIEKTSSLYRTVQRMHNTMIISIESFRALMPNKIIAARQKGDDTYVIESSSLSSHELDDAEKLCIAITSAIHRYSIGEPIVEQKETSSGEDSDYEPMSMSFKGFGEHIMVEHTLPHEEPITTTVEAPVEPTEESNFVVYHLQGANGQPFDINLDQAEVDDIIHRIEIAQHPSPHPEEPTHSSEEIPNEHPLNHQEAPVDHQETPVDHQEEPEEQELIKEIEQLLRGEQSQQEEENQTPTEPSNTREEFSSLSPGQEERELQSLLQAMQEAGEPVKKTGR